MIIYNTKFIQIFQSINIFQGHGNIQPINTLFQEEDGIMNVKLINSKNILSRHDFENSRQLLWRAPEINQSYSKFVSSILSRIEIWICNGRINSFILPIRVLIYKHTRL